MTEAKHTPGPWKLGEDGHMIYGTNPRGHIASVYHNIKGNMIASDDECKQAHSNARLIAAAPELRLTLEEFVNVIDGFNSKQPNPLFDSMIKRGRAMLAKAEGVEQ